MIVVTGGAGFIGSNLVAELSEHGEDVAVADMFGSGDKWKNLRKHDIAAFVAPERLFDFLDELGSSTQAIVHLGALSSTTEADVDRLIETNVRLSLSIWDWCANRKCRLIYASSAATYGDGSAGFSDDGSRAALARLRPLNAYAWSKHVFDRRVAAVIGAQGPVPPQWAGLKFFNVYGPNEYHKGSQESVVAKAFRELSGGRPVRLLKSGRKDVPDGEQRRDFVWVGDCVAVIRWLLASPSISGIYNVGSGVARTFRELAEAVISAADVPAKIEFVEFPPSLQAHYQYYTCADLRKLREAGYHRPFTSLEAGVRKYVVDYLAAKDIYR